MISKAVSIIATITILAIAAVLLTYNNNVGMAQQVPFSPQPQTPQPQTPQPQTPYLHGYFYPGWIENRLGPRLGYYHPPPQPPHNNVIISPPPTAAIPPTQGSGNPLLPSPPSITPVTPPSITPVTPLQPQPQPPQSIPPFYSPYYKYPPYLNQYWLKLRLGLAPGLGLGGLGPRLGIMSPPTDSNGNGNNNNDQVQVISQSNECGNGNFSSVISCQNIRNQIQSGGSEPICYTGQCLWKWQRSI